MLLILGMDPIYFMLGILGIYFGGIFYARKFSEKALELINLEQKGQMIDGFKQVRKRGMYIMFGIVITYVLFMTVGAKTNLISSKGMDASIWIYFVAIFGYLIYQQMSSLKIYKQLEFPEDFIALMKKGILIRIIVLFFACAGMLIYLISAGLV